MMNHLLLWMSARSEGSMQALRAEIARAEGEYGAAGRDGHRRGWDLARLGHAELGAASPGGGWKVAPPVLAARSLSAGASAVLCGARTPGLLRALEAAAQRSGAQVRVTPQEAAPDLVELIAAAPSALAATAGAAGISLQPRATRAVIAAAGSIADAPIEPASMPIGQGWEVSRFSLSGLRWTPASVAQAGAAVVGLFRFKSDYETHIILRDSAGTWRCPPDVGKYRLLQRRHRPLAYSAPDRIFRAAIGARPPPLVERALVIASGRLPAREGSWLAYQGIELADAHAAADQLRQKLY